MQTREILMLSPNSTHPTGMPRGGKPTLTVEDVAAKVGYAHSKINRSKLGIVAQVEDAIDFGKAYYLKSKPEILAMVATNRFQRILREEIDYRSIAAVSRAKTKLECQDFGDLSNKLTLGLMYIALTEFLIPQICHGCGGIGFKEGRKCSGCFGSGIKKPTNLNRAKIIDVSADTIRRNSENLNYVLRILQSWKDEFERAIYKVG